MSDEELTRKIVSLEERMHKLERKVSVKLYFASHHVEPPRKELLTTREAADYLGLTEAGMRNLARSGAIPYYKPNRKNLYFEIEDLTTFQRQNRKEAKVVSS